MFQSRSTAAAILGVSFLVSGCVTGERPSISAETLPPPIGSDVVEPGDLEKERFPTGGPQSGGPSSGAGMAMGTGVNPEAVALLTPTGVVVPVISIEEDHYLVMTPCGNEQELVWGTPIEPARIVLDPGHGGEIETGAIGDNGLQEKDLNLVIAKRTARILQERGADVGLTRTGDYRIPLSTRVEIGTALGAEILVSIHHNAPNWLSSDEPGTEIFVQSESVESRRLGGVIWEEVVDALGQFEDVEWTTADDAGAIEVLNRQGEDTYGMVRRPEMVAVLVELGYISNPSEAALFATDDYVEVASTALADGIQRWFETEDPGAGYQPEPRKFTASGKTGGSGGCVDPDLE